MFQVNNKDAKLWAYFTSCSSVSNVNYEHVIASKVDSVDKNMAISF